jgi:5-methylcytosine-specific restriction endonuclease McrA
MSKAELAAWINDVLTAFDALNTCVYNTGKKAHDSTRVLCEPLNAVMAEFEDLIQSTKTAVVNAEKEGLEMRLFIQVQWSGYCPWIKKVVNVLLTNHVFTYPNCGYKISIAFPSSAPLQAYVEEDVPFASERFHSFPKFLKINGLISLFGCSKCQPARNYCVCSVNKLPLNKLKDQYVAHIDAGAKLDGAKKKQLQEALLNNTKMTCTPPVKKTKISTRERFITWNERVGIEVGRTLCDVCEENYISQQDFHCGHIIAEANGGTTTLDNLIPICSTCNNGMGTTNMMEYKEQLDAFKRGRAIEEKDYLF